MKIIGIGPGFYIGGGGGVGGGPVLKHLCMHYTSNSSLYVSFVDSKGTDNVTKCSVVSLVYVMTYKIYFIYSNEFPKLTWYIYYIKHVYIHSDYKIGNCITIIQCI